MGYDKVSIEVLLNYSYEATRMWAEMALRWYGQELGADSSQALEMAVVATAVEAHGGWGSRKQEHVGKPTHTN